MLIKLQDKADGSRSKALQCLNRFPKMNQSFLDIFRWSPRNESFVTPGFYDTDIFDCTFIICTSLLFLSIQTGFGLMESGIVSRKAETNVLMKFFADCCIGGISYWALGFGLMFGRGLWNNSFFGFGDFFLNPSIGDDLMPKIFTFFLYQMSFSQTATSIVGGACAERMSFPAYMVFAFFNFYVYSIGAGWIWGE